MMAEFYALSFCEANELLILLTYYIKRPTIRYSFYVYKQKWLEVGYPNKIQK